MAVSTVAPTSSEPPAAPTPLVAVLDMGASAVRLVIAELSPGAPVRTIEDLTRGVLLGRDTFSAGVIRPQTADATLRALEGFSEVIAGYGVQHVRAVATSAVREARNGDLFLDRVRGRTGISFETIDEAEESRLMYLAVRHTLGAHPALTEETIKLIYDSPNANELDNPDNITVTPRGGLLMCEDAAGNHFLEGERLIGLTLHGQAFTFGQNNVNLTAAQIASAGKTIAPGDYRQSEWAGACYSLDGKWLFVNIQTPGITFAITGPWGRGPL